MEITKIKNAVAIKMKERNDKIKALHDQKMEELRKLRRDAAKTASQKLSLAKEIKETYMAKKQEVKDSFRGEANEKVIGVAPKPKPIVSPQKPDGKQIARVMPVLGLKTKLSAGGGKRRLAARTLRKK